MSSDVENVFAKEIKRQKRRSALVKIFFFGGMGISIISAYIVPSFIMDIAPVFPAIYDVNTVVNGIALAMVFAGIILWTTARDKSRENLSADELRSLAEDDYPRGWK